MLTLVIGGAASGKSAYAEHLAVQSGGPRYYLATMQVWDAECAARVAKHRAMRAQKQFATVECPQNLHLVRLPQQGTALLEDLGNLAANELYRPDGSCLPPKQAAEKMLAGIEAIAAQCNHLIIVSNEVFSGGADYAGETDLYLQALAMVNNAVAAKADAAIHRLDIGRTQGDKFVRQNGFQSTRAGGKKAVDMHGVPGRAAGPLPATLRKSA